MVRSAEELFAVEKMAAQGTSIKKIAVTVGVFLSMTKRWPHQLRSEGEMVSRSVRRQRGTQDGLSLLSLQFRLTSLHLRVVCGSDSLRLLWNELKTQLAQYPAPANPAELRALLTRVSQNVDSRWTFEKMARLGSAG